MRLPNLRDLTEDQKQVYLYAPVDQHVLVEGPPGTGKTLIAGLRALELRKRERPVVFGMFNRVLKKYTSAVPDGEMPAETVYRWFSDWWHKAKIPPYPQCEQLIVECSYDERHDVRELGARWRKDVWTPGRIRPGAWTIDLGTWSAAPEAFSRWTISHNPPVLTGKRTFDWETACTVIQENLDNIPDEALSLGTILIDEGQDFPPAFYRCLRAICAVALSRGSAIPNPPRCFVLADENQQLTEHNSTLDEIQAELRIPQGARYRLLDNFRNTRQIAELARGFFADVGVLPRLPQRTGETPVYQRVKDDDEIADFIVRWIRNNPRKEVGVIAFRDQRRQDLYDRLTTKLRRNSQIKVQTYSSLNAEYASVDELAFDQPNTVTVLNIQSCKGLEFDAVFVVRCSDARQGTTWQDRFRMQMFVATSRARENVYIIDCGASADMNAVASEMPGAQVLQRERTPTITPPSAPSPPAAASTGSGGSRGTDRPDWIQAAETVAAKQRGTIRDKRGVGGAYWVLGDASLRTSLESYGFKYVKGKGWWRK